MRARPILASLLALLALVAPVPVGAQLPLDFKGGLNLSEFVGGDVESDTRSGVNLGLAVSPLRIGPVAVVAEVYYRQKGAEAFQSLQGGGDLPPVPPEAIEVGLDYIELQPLLRLSFPLASWLGAYVQGGPAFGWQLDCSVSLDAAAQESDPMCEDLLGSGLEDTLRDYEQGLVLGGALELFVPGGVGAVVLDGRLTRGLSRLTEEEEGPEVKNQSVSLMLGYTFSPTSLVGRMR